jgi:hypothetical protein
MLNKDYNRNNSVAKKEKSSGLEPEGSWHQDETIGGKAPIVK